MATKTKAEKKVDDLAKRFDSLVNAMESVLSVVESMKANQAPTAAVASPVEPKDIAQVSVVASEKAKPNRVTTNPEWEEVAQEILGKALDHTEVEHEKSGGIKFTVVIKNEYSNADKQYLEVNKVDRRSKEISHEGLSGVEEWCRQIKANLSRTQKIGVRQ